MTHRAEANMDKKRQLVFLMLVLLLLVKQKISMADIYCGYFVLKWANTRVFDPLFF